jgi:Carbohydrate binding domain (family 11)
VRVWFFFGSALGVAMLGAAPGCNLILDNDPGQLAAGTAGAGASIANGGSKASGGSTANGGSKANGGSSTGASGGKAGTSAAGGMGGSAGSGASGMSGGAGAGGTAAVCTNPLLIDDLEDGDSTIAPCGGRIGYWFVYNDYGQKNAQGVVSTCMEMPPPTASDGSNAFPPTPGGNAGSAYSAHTNGSGCTTFGAGLGFDFHNVNLVSTPYDASAHHGITFWAKGSLPAASELSAEVPIPATTAQGEQAGTCVGTAGVECDDHFYIHLTPTSSWLMYAITFGDAAHFSQSGFGTPATFDPAHVIGMRFQVPANITFDFSIDDVMFF